MKLGVPFLQFPLQFDAAALAAEVQAIDESAWRPHPAGYAGNDALLLVTVGGDPEQRRDFRADERHRAPAALSLPDAGARPRSAAPGAGRA